MEELVPRKIDLGAKVSGIIALVGIIFYLPIFISNATWKIGYEENIIKSDLESGITPEVSPAFDFHSLSNLIDQEGWWIVGVILLFSILFGAFLFGVNFIKTKLWRVISKCISIIVIDLIVAYLVAVSTNDINNLLRGGGVEWNWTQAFISKEFYTVLFLGAFPIAIITFLAGYWGRGL